MVWIGTTRSKPKGWLALFATGILFSACASAPPHTDYFEKSGAIGEAEAFLSGEALAQRKQKMGRTHRDMKYFFATIESLRRHRKTVEITIFEARSFPFITKTPPAAELIKKAAGLQKGSGVPHKEKVGKLTKDQIREIATTKLPDLNANDLDAAMKIVEGTARSMGVTTD